MAVNEAKPVSSEPCDYGIVPAMKRLSLIILGVILILGLVLRIPFIRSGMPYFYDEDEGHHFNRIVRMTQRGDFDPQYWHKPSLHFYLRMPVVAASFLASAKAGELQSIKEIVTKDPAGVGEYAFSASHPKIAKWNRAFSVALSVLTILLTFLLALRVTKNRGAALCGALLVALSPGLVAGSATIQVDGVMTFFAALTALVAWHAYERFSIRALVAVGILAGLTISTKYNAAPIAVLPLVLVLTQPNRSFGLIVTALLTPVLGFIAGSPFLFAHIPDFLDQVAYEVWHYGTAGHEGHTGQPGLSQMRFFLSWFISEGIGLVGVILALIGAVRLVKIDRKGALVFLSFPILYFALMSAQKANFTRNLWVLVPFFSVAAAAGIAQLSAINSKARYATLLVILLAAGSLGYHSAALGNEATHLPESRLTVAEWLNTHPGRTAVAQELQFVRSVTKSADRVVVKGENITKEELQALKAKFLVVGSSMADQRFSKLPVEQEFPGNARPQRIVQNPAIKILRVE